MSKFKKAAEFIIANSNICPTNLQDIQIKADEQTREEFCIEEPIHLWESYCIGDAEEEKLLANSNYDSLDELFSTMDSYYEQVSEELYEEFVACFSEVIYLEEDDCYYATTLDVVLQSEKEMCFKSKLDSKYDGLECYRLQDCNDVIEEYLQNNLQYTQYNRSFHLDRKDSKCYELQDNQFIVGYDDTFDICFHRESTSNHGNWFDFSYWIGENKDWEWCLKEYLEILFDENDGDIDLWLEENDLDSSYDSKIQWFKDVFDFNERLEWFKNNCSDYVNAFNFSAKQEAIDKLLNR